MNREAKQQELQQLRTRVQALERELQPPISPEWPPRGFYLAYAVLTGFVLGGVAAMTSLLFNVIGSLINGLHPLQLIRVYLTFPLGQQAENLESGLALAVGCCLYVLTGMVLGIPFQWVLSRWFDCASLKVRFAVVSAMAIALWIFNFYCVLSWLQNVLFGGSWIVEDVPWWVAALTHLVFGWSMLILQPFGRFVAERPNS